LKEKHYKYKELIMEKKVSLFNEIKIMNEEELEAKKTEDLIRDDDDLEFEEQLAKATRPAKENTTDLPSFLQDTNNL
jgi:hypothetical protein